MASAAGASLHVQQAYAVWCIKRSVTPMSKHTRGKGIIQARRLHLHRALVRCEQDMPLLLWRRWHSVEIAMKLAPGCAVRPALSQLNTSRPAGSIRMLLQPDCQQALHRCERGLCKLRHSLLEFEILAVYLLTWKEHLARKQCCGIPLAR